MKSNKSFSKRLRVTRNGKIIARVPGQNHFNAKEGRRRQMRRRRMVSFGLNNKSRQQFLQDAGSKK